jgi:Ca-activated chloride channel family protein
MTFRFALAAGLLVMTMPATGALAADRAIVVLDASGSMWAQIDEVPRITIARETIKEVLAGLPVGLDLGLIAYGHREKGSCTDIETLVEPAAGSAAAIAAAIDRINPKGKTPLSAAVKRAAEELRYTEEKATVILVTDGIETCDADPCALASELESGGVGFTAHVVGFGLTDEEGRKVACLAENTGGMYVRAGNGDALAKALTQTVAQASQPAAAPEPAPAPAPQSSIPEFNFAPVALMAEGDDPLPGSAGNAWEVYSANADGSRGEYISTDYGNNWKVSLEPGKYVVVARYGEAGSEQPVTIEAGKVAEPLFVLNAGTLIVRPLAVPDGEPVDGAAVNLVYPGGETTGYGQVTFIAPAGEQKLTVRIGAGELSETVVLSAGDTITKDVVVGVGRAVVNAAYAAGMKVEDGGLFVEILKSAKKLDGSRESVVSGYGPDSAHEVPPGDYVLRARIGEAEAETPFSVKVGETTDVEVVLDAGVLAISAPGAHSIEILGAKKDIQGKRKSFSYSYGEEFQTTLPAGDYIVVARSQNDNPGKEAEAKVVAGERTETAVTLP